MVYTHNTPDVSTLGFFIVLKNNFVVSKNNNYVCIVIEILKQKTNKMKRPNNYKTGFVYTTKDYHLFSTMPGNRDTKDLHLSRLKKSMSENYLFTVILVNELFQIIDGQHRFLIIKELGLPLNYIICEGYGLSETQILNQNMSKWDTGDYLSSWISKGNKDYIVYAEFQEKYKFGHNETMLLLGGLNKKQVDIFKEGLFKVKSLPQAERNADKILKIEQYYDGFKRRSFIFAMLGLFKKPQFNFEEFLQKLKLQPRALKDCPSTDSYKELIEEIYNYRRKDKVNLRY